MRSIVVAIALAAVACGGAVDYSSADEANSELAPTGKGMGTVQSEAHSGGGGKPAQNGIVYHGGPVMHGAVNVYYIWYGNWSGNPAQNILTDFISHLGGTPYEHIDTTYSDGSGPVSGQINYAGSANDSYSQGTALSDAQIQAVVAGAIPSLN